MAFTPDEYLRCTGTATCASVPNSTVFSYLGLTEVAAIGTSAVEQIQNLGSTTISAAQWGYLGALDQAVGTGSSVEFAGLTLTAGATIYTDGTLKILVSSSDKLAFVGGTPAEQYGDLPVLDEEWIVTSPYTTDNAAIIVSDFNTYTIPCVETYLDALGTAINYLPKVLEQYNLTATS